MSRRNRSQSCMARFILVWGVICQDVLLCVYHDCTEHATSALCDVYLEAMVSLGSEIFIHWMVLPALSCWKDPWPHSFCISWDSVITGAPECVFSWIPTWSGGIALVISLVTQIMIYFKVVSLLLYYSVYLCLLDFVVRKSQLLTFFLVSRTLVKGQKITVIGTSPWPASATSFLAMENQFQ